MASATRFLKEAARPSLDSEKAFAVAGELKARWLLSQLEHAFGISVFKVLEKRLGVDDLYAGFALDRI